MQPSKKAKIDPQDSLALRGTTNSEHRTVDSYKMKEDWREGLTSISQIRGHMFDHSINVDCSFRVGPDDDQEVVRSHKVHLSEASSVFQAMFYGALPEKGEIRVTDINPDIFKILIRYVYTDVLPEDLTADSLLELGVAADKYLIHALCETTCTKLCSLVEPSNVWNLLCFADKMSSSALTEAALKVVCEHAEQVLRSSDMVQVPRSVMLALVKQDGVNIYSELTLISACDRWAQYNKKPGQDLRSVLGPEIIDKLRFLSLSVKQCAEVTKNLEWLSGHEKADLLQTLICSDGKEVMKGRFYFHVAKALDKPIPDLPDPVVKPIHSTLILSQETGTSFFHNSFHRHIYRIHCESEVFLNGLVFYTQDKNAIMEAKDSNTTCSSNTYAEDISINVYIYHPETITSGKKILSERFREIVAYNSTCEVKFNPPANIPAGMSYNIDITFNQGGCYPVVTCPSTKFKYGQFNFNIILTHDNNKTLDKFKYCCPLYAVNFSRYGK